MTFLCEVAALDAGFPTRVELADGRQVAVYLVGDDVYATEDICSHGEAKLSDGFIEGFEVVCPFHAGRFDVRTGEPTCIPCVVPIRSFKVMIRDGQVHLMTDGT